MKFENINQAAKNWEIIPGAVILALFPCFVFWMTYCHFPALLVSTLLFTSLLVTILLEISISVSILDYIRWHKTAKHKICTGNDFPCHRSGLKLFSVILSLAAVTIILAAVIYTLFVPDSSEATLTDCKYFLIILLAPFVISLITTVYETDNDFLLKKIIENVKRTCLYEYKIKNYAGFHAEKIYYVQEHYEDENEIDSHYIICYNDKIIQLDYCGGRLNCRQMETVYEKF